MQQSLLHDWSRLAELRRMSRIKILIVEDEAVVAMDLEERLTKFGYQVIGSVANGAAAIKQASTHHPNLVLMDIRLQGTMDGIATAQELRTRFNIPVIYLTANVDEVTLQRAQFTRPFGYLMKPFHEHELQVAIEIAIYHHLTEHELHHQANQMRAFSSQLLNHQEEERTTLARELHDGIGQSLTALKLNLQNATRKHQPDHDPSISDSIGIIDQTLLNIRTQAFNLRPAILDDLGLVAALRWYLDRQQQHIGIEMHLTTNLQDIRLPPEQEINCFRIVQEAITNIIRHSRANSVQVTLRQYKTKVYLSIYDDGIGFDVEAAIRASASGVSSGLLAMQERAGMMGGQFMIESLSDMGTIVQASLPRVTDQRPNRRHQARSSSPRDTLSR